VPKSLTTVALDEDLLRAVRARATRSGKGVSEVVEESLRATLGFDLLDRLWRTDMSEQDALSLALEAQRANLESEPLARRTS
jgi:plasmid stability protein